MFRSHTEVVCTEGSKSNVPCCALLAQHVHATFASDSRMWRASSVNLAHMLRKCASCTCSPRIMRMLRTRSAQQGMLLLDPSVVLGIRLGVCASFNEEPAWKLTQKVALTHDSVKKMNVTSLTSWKSHDVVPSASFTRHDVSHYSVDVAVITELCIGAAYRISSSGSLLRTHSINVDSCGRKHRP
jgi:hypothetical protein